MHLLVTFLDFGGYGVSTLSLCQLRCGVRVAPTIGGTPEFWHMFRQRGIYFAPPIGRNFRQLAGNFAGNFDGKFDGNFAGNFDGNFTGNFDIF